MVVASVVVLAFVLYVVARVAMNYGVDIAIPRL